MKKILFAAVGAYVLKASFDLKCLPKGNYFAPCVYYNLNSNPSHNFNPP